MTTINRVYDPRLGRYRDPYPHELSPLLRAATRSITTWPRRDARDARERTRREGREQR